MDIQRLRIDQTTILSNPGKQSVQIIWSQNAPDAQVTITRVTMEPGAISGSAPSPPFGTDMDRGTRLGASSSRGRTNRDDCGGRRPPHTGHDHARCREYGAGPFAYLAITCPAEDMTDFYKVRHDR